MRFVLQSLQMQDSEHLHASSYLVKWLWAISDSMCIAAAVEAPVFRQLPPLHCSLHRCCSVLVISTIACLCCCPAPGSLGTTRQHTDAIARSKDRAEQLRDCSVIQRWSLNLHRVTSKSHTLWAHGVEPGAVEEGQQTCRLQCLQGSSTAAC